MPAVPTELRKTSVPGFRIPLKSHNRNSSQTRELPGGLRRQRVVEEHSCKEPRQGNRFSLLLESFRRRSKSADVRNDCTTHPSAKNREPAFLQPHLVPSITSSKPEVQMAAVKITNCGYNQYRLLYNSLRGCPTAPVCRPYSKKSEYCNRPLSVIEGSGNGDLTVLPPPSRVRNPSQLRPSSFHPTSRVSELSTEHHNPYLYQKAVSFSSSYTNESEEKRLLRPMHPEQEPMCSVMSNSLFDYQSSLAQDSLPALTVLSRAESTRIRNVAIPFTACYSSTKPLPMTKGKVRTLSPIESSRQIFGGLKIVSNKNPNAMGSTKNSRASVSHFVSPQSTPLFSSFDCGLTHSSSTKTTFKESNTPTRLRVANQVQPCPTFTDICQVTACHPTPKLCPVVIQSLRQDQQDRVPIGSVSRPASTFVSSDVGFEFVDKPHLSTNGLRSDGAMNSVIGDVRQICAPQLMNCGTILMRQSSEPVDRASWERQSVRVNNGMAEQNNCPTSGSPTTNDCLLLNGHTTNRGVRQCNRTDHGTIPTGLAKGVQESDLGQILRLTKTNEGHLPAQQQSVVDCPSQSYSGCERTGSPKNILLSGLRNSWSSSVDTTASYSSRTLNNHCSSNIPSSPSRLPATAPLGTVGLPPPMSFALGPKLRSQPKATFPNLSKLLPTTLSDRSVQVTGTHSRARVDVQVSSERSCPQVVAPVPRPPRPPLRTTSLVRGTQSRDTSCSDSNATRPESNRSSFAESDPAPSGCSSVMGTGDLTDKLADNEVEQTVCNKETMWWLRLLPYKPSNLPNKLADRLRQRDSLILSRASPSAVLSNSSLPTSIPQFFVPTTQCKSSRSPHLMSQSMYDQRDPTDSLSLSPEPTVELNSGLAQLRGNRSRVAVRPSSLYTEKPDVSNLLMSASTQFVTESSNEGSSTPQNSILEPFISHISAQSQTKIEQPPTASKNLAQSICPALSHPPNSRFHASTDQTDSPLLGQYCRLLILCSSNPTAPTTSDLPTPSGETPLTPV